MPEGPQPQGSIRVPPEILEMMGDYKAAAKEISREIKALEKEAAQAVKAAEKIERTKVRIGKDKIPFAALPKEMQEQIRKEAGLGPATAEAERLERVRKRMRDLEEKRDAVLNRHKQTKGAESAFEKIVERRLRKGAGRIVGPGLKMAQKATAEAEAIGVELYKSGYEKTGLAMTRVAGAIGGALPTALPLAALVGLPLWALYKLGMGVNQAREIKAAAEGRSAERWANLWIRARTDGGGYKPEQLAEMQRRSAAQMERESVKVATTSARSAVASFFGAQTEKATKRREEMEKAFLAQAEVRMEFGTGAAAFMDIETLRGQRYLRDRVRRRVMTGRTGAVGAGWQQLKDWFNIGETTEDLIQQEAVKEQKAVGDTFKEHRRRRIKEFYETGVTSSLHRSQRLQQALHLREIEKYRREKYLQWNPY